MYLLGGVFFYFLRNVGVYGFSGPGIFMADAVHDRIEIHSGDCRHRNIGVPENVRAFLFGNARHLA